MKEKLLAYYREHKAESIVSGIVVVLLVGTAGFLLVPRLAKIKLSNPFPRMHTKVVTVPTPTLTADQQIGQKNAEIVGEVSKQIKLPTDEDPVFATVSDTSKLQNQDFFKQAQNGDKILLYKKNKLAFLYRPSTNEVIAQAPLEYQDTPEASVAAATTQVAPAQKGPVPTIAPRGKLLYNNQ